MPTSGSVEERLLVHAIMISEKSIPRAKQNEYLSKAFPDQVTLEVKDGELRMTYGSTFSVLWLTYDGWIKPKHRNAFLACVGNLEEGTHTIPSDWTTQGISDDEFHEWMEGTRCTSKVLQRMIGDLLLSSKGSDTSYAYSSEYVRTWSIIDGPEVKEGFFGKPRPSRILAVGIYHA